MSSPRAVAADIIGRVIAGQSLNRLLPEALDAVATLQRPLCQELVYGTLREWHCLKAVCLSFLAKPLRRKDQDIMALLCIGLYELEHLSTPAHAVVSETVNATRALKKPWARCGEWRTARIPTSGGCRRRGPVTSGTAGTACLATRRAEHSV